MECGGCTLCCRLLAVPWMDSPAGEACRECTGNGCRLWPNPPAKCKAYACAWLQMEKASVDLRPDNCRAIFELVDDLFFLITPDVNFELTEVMERQILQLMKEGYSVVLRDGNRLKLWRAEQHSAEQIKTAFRRVEQEALERKEAMGGNVR